MQINIPIKTKQPEQISVQEVRTELRKIDEVMFSELVTPQTITKLNTWLEARINQPYGLMITAEWINGNVKLYGGTSESKEVLDPNFKKEFITKKR